MNQPGISFTRTRIAPTPSGFLHIGNLLAFAVTAAMAQKANAGILLRIDDMDRERMQPEYIRDIFDTLRFMQLPWQEGPQNAEQLEAAFSQRYRMPLYEGLLRQLREAGAVYACDCSRTKIAAGKLPGGCAGNCRERNISLDVPGINWRLKTDRVPIVTVNTIQGAVTAVLPDDMKDFVVRKRDGFPAYQLTSLADDIHFNIDGIIRGEDLWHSTLAQLNLAAQLQLTAFSAITFYHHPLLKDGDGKKLSKSAGATSVKYLREQHNTAAAIYALIGNSLQPAVQANHWSCFL